MGVGEGVVGLGLWHVYVFTSQSPFYEICPFIVNST